MDKQDNPFNFQNPFTSYQKNSPSKEELINQTPLKNFEKNQNIKNSSLYDNYLSNFATPKKLDFNNGIFNTPFQISNEFTLSPFVSNSKNEMSNHKIQNIRKNSLIDISPFNPMTNNNILSSMNKELFVDKK